MITQKEAKELYDKSGAEVQSFLETQCDKAIRKAATDGKKTVEIGLGSLNEYSAATPSALHTQVIAELKKLGFTARFDKFGEAYIPRGLANDDNTGPYHRNYGIIVGW